MLDKLRMGPELRTLKVLEYVALSTALISIFLIPVLLFPANEPDDSFWHRGEYFWWKVLWSEVVFTVAWFLGLQIPFRSLMGQRQQAGGAFPAISRSVLSACILSYLILLVTLFLPHQRIYLVLPIVVQIAVIVVCTFQIFALQHVKSLQQDGIDPIPFSIKQPDEIAAQLLIYERKASAKNPQLAKKLRALSEKVNYSLPRVGRISTSVRYTTIIQNIDALCAQLDNVKDVQSIQPELDIIERDIALLIVELKL